MKGKQQRKLSYKSISQQSKYLDYSNGDLGNLYFITQKGNQFYFNIWNSRTEAYYAKPIRTKSQVFDIFQKFVCQIEHQSENKI